MSSLVYTHRSGATTVIEFKATLGAKIPCPCGGCRSYLNCAPCDVPLRVSAIADDNLTARCRQCGHMTVFPLRSALEAL